MNFITPNFRHDFDQPDDLDPGLKSMIASYQSDITATDNEQFFSWPDKVTIDQGLKGSGSIDSGQGVTRES